MRASSRVTLGVEILPTEEIGDLAFEGEENGVVEGLGDGEEKVEGEG